MQYAEHPGLLSLGQDRDADSTAAGSSVGTPRTSMPPSGTKLKLNFSAIGNHDRD